MEPTDLLSRDGKYSAGGAEQQIQQQMEIMRLQSEDLSPQQLMEAANNWAKRNSFAPEQLQVMFDHAVQGRAPWHLPHMHNQGRCALEGYL